MVRSGRIFRGTGRSSSSCSILENTPTSSAPRRMLFGEISLLVSHYDFSWWCCWKNKPVCITSAWWRKSTLRRTSCKICWTRSLGKTRPGKRFLNCVNVMPSGGKSKHGWVPWGPETANSSTKKRNSPFPGCSVSMDWRCREIATSVSCWEMACSATQVWTFKVRYRCSLTPRVSKPYFVKDKIW